jgi:hypothetical protein
MRTINLPRGGGKTTRLLALMRKQPDMVMLTHSEDSARCLTRDNPDLKGRIMGFETFRAGLHRPTPPVCIDNLDLILELMLRTGIRVATISREKP